MKNLTNWLIAVIIILFVAYYSVVSTKILYDRQTDISDRLDRIQATVDRTETVSGHIYQQQSYEVYLKDWRNLTDPRGGDYARP
jgi:hypothetical protein